jgi:hypothetical protein
MSGASVRIAPSMSKEGNGCADPDHKGVDDAFFVLRERVNGTTDIANLICPGDGVTVSRIYTRRQ